MAKRHHASEKKHSEGHYEGHSARRRQEMMDGGMISEDHSAIANMPQNVMIKPYPMDMNYLPEDLDDTIRGVDKQEGMDHGKSMKHFHPKKV